MRVAVQAARVKQHRQIRIERHCAQPRHVLRVRSRESATFHPFGAEHVRGREVGQHLRREDGAQAALRHGGRERARRGRLLPVIELIDESLAPSVDQADQVGVDLVSALIGGREGAQHVEVARDIEEDARPLHLDGHRLARRAQRAFVHLADGGRCDWLGREFGEDVAKTDAELALDDRAAERGLEGSHTVLQLGEPSHVRRRHEVRPDRERLPEFDECWAQFCDQVEQGLRALLGHPLLALEHLVEDDREHEAAAQPRELHHATQHRHRPLSKEGISSSRVVLALTIGHFGGVGCWRTIRLRCSAAHGASRNATEGWRSGEGDQRDTD